jgi:hypothetical protein
MKRISLALLLLTVGIPASPPPASAKPNVQRRGVGKRSGPRSKSASASWLPKGVREAFWGERYKSTQGPKLQGGKLEGSIVHAQIDSQYKSTQGTALQGGTLDHSVVRTPIASSSAPSAATSELEGLRRGMRPFTVKVVSQMPEPCPPAVGSSQPFTLYELEIDGENPCAGEALAPEFDRPQRTACEQENWETYRGKALAVEGGWGTRMSYVSSSAAQPFSTFSCMSGAMAKCMRFGYRPWEGEAQSELFQACIRAARGDYCGTGMSYTCDGTLFDIADTNNLQQRAPNNADEMLEADWTSAGATCLNTARLPGCSSDTDMRRLLTVIAEECEAHRHPIRIGGCRDTCPEGATCGSPVRTWMVTGQTHLCETSLTYCPAEPSSASR